MRVSFNSPVLRSAIDRKLPSSVSWVLAFLVFVLCAILAFILSKTLGLAPFRGSKAGRMAHYPNAIGLRVGFNHLWHSYNHVLAKRPLLTKMATGVVGTIIGDGVAQFGTHKLTASSQPGKLQKPFEYDVPRMLRLCFWSAFVGSPMGHYWFQFLDNRIMPHNPKSMQAVLTKLVLDQAIMAPIGIGLFFMGIKALEGAPERAYPEMLQKIQPTLMANWCLWPLANFVNFRLVPPEQRILYVNVISVAWAGYMSYASSRK